MKMTKERGWEIVDAAFCAGLALFIIYLTHTTFLEEDVSRGGPFANSAFYPRLVAFIIALLAILLFISSLIKKKGKAPLSSVEKREAASEEALSDRGKALEQEGVSGKVTIAIAFVLVLYTLLLDSFGYLVVTPFFMVVLFRLLKVRKWITTVLLSLISTAVLYLFFSKVLEVILPPGRYALISW